MELADALYAGVLGDIHDGPHGIRSSTSPTSIVTANFPGYDPNLIDRINTYLNEAGFNVVNHHTHNERVDATTVNRRRPEQGLETRYDGVMSQLDHTTLDGDDIFYRRDGDNATACVIGVKDSHISLFDYGRILALGGCDLVAVRYGPELIDSLYPYMEWGAYVPFVLLAVCNVRELLNIATGGLKDSRVTSRAIQPKQIDRSRVEFYDGATPAGVTVTLQMPDVEDPYAAYNSLESDLVKLLDGNDVHPHDSFTTGAKSPLLIKNRGIIRS